MHREKNRLPLLPYKEVGKFCGHLAPVFYSMEHHHYMALATGTSYKIMTVPDLKTKILGPTLTGQITAIQPFNELLYVAVGNKVLKFHFLHLLNQFEFSSDIQSMLLAGEILIILLKEENRVVVRNVKTGLNLSDLTLEFQPLGLIHPPTYLNKVLFWAEQSLALYNVNTANKLISFDQVASVSKLILTGKQITLVEASPAVDVVAIGFETGLLGLVNLKTGVVLRSFQASARLNCVGFSLDITRVPLLLTGDDSGAVLNWDLNKGEILHAHRSAHSGKPITFLKFLNFEGKDMYLTGSQADNSIKLWNKQDPADTQYYALRTRAGCISPLKSLKFFGAEGTHVLGFSGGDACEILDFSLLREDMTTKLSRKDSHVNKYTATERSEHVGEVLSASASHNRSGDWPSLITANRGNLRPCFWDVEDRTIVKLSAQLYDSGKSKKLSFIEDIGRERRFISKVTITLCGNFGVAGYNNGYIVKISMQNAGHIKTFYNTSVHQNKDIKGLLVDSLNRFLVSADDEAIALWDFYSGIFQRKIDLSGFAVRFLVPDEHSQIFGIVTTTAEIRLMEYSTLQEVRIFTGASKGEVNDCTDNSLSVWDIFTEKLVCKYKLEREVVCMGISPDLSYLATVFKGDSHISLWHINRLSLYSIKPLKVVYASHLNFVGENKREHYFAEDSDEHDSEAEELKDIDEELYNEIESALEANEAVAASSSARSKLISFTDIPQNKWMPLNYIEQIEERNKPEKAQSMETPFFLEFDNPLTRLKQEIEAEVMKKDLVVASKIIRQNKKNQFLEEVGGDANKILASLPAEGEELLSKDSKKAHKRLFEVLKGTAASQINYFIRGSLFEDAQNCTRLLAMFLTLFKHPSDFDIKSVMYKVFLENAYDKIGSRSEDLVLFKRIEALQSQYTSRLDETYTYLSSLLARSSTATNNSLTRSKSN